jgi:prepilin-type N-terminal cleavage/methylation domain-containing protein/prepilin-type processing-associated H-X9-DG protein
MNKRPARKAFTLIELLVVISIIALLVGILLPALGAARKAAQAVVCLGHQRGLGQAVAAYVTVASNHLPGPNTSGAYLWQNNAYQGNGPSEPVQSWDWISPTLGDSIGFSSDPLTRYRDIYETEFKCPSNDVIYDYQYTGVSIDKLTTSSYTSPMGFQGGDNFQGYHQGFPITSALDVPENTGSKMDAMGPPSIKMWAMDGSRYVNNQGLVSFDTLIKGNNHGGNFMSRSPALATPRSGGSPFRVDNSGELSESSLRTGFRHNAKMNGVFLDGHADSFDNESAREPEYYFPTGSEIRSAYYFVAPVLTGTVLK